MALHADRLAGMGVAELRDRFRRELFDEWLPFWEAHGIDHELGGFQCGLDYGGALVHPAKFVWFQGRGIWVYSFLHRHFRAEPRFLDIARKTKDFLLRHAPQPDGAWASLLSREGRCLAVAAGDPYGAYFAVEGLQEYAQAAGDPRALEMARQLFRALCRQWTRPEAEFAGAGGPGFIPQGFWMVNLRIATQCLQRNPDPEMEAIASQCIEAIVDRHYDPHTGLTSEYVRPDGRRPVGMERLCNFGHSIETLWMVLDEARRRGDRRLAETAIERIRRHLEAGWDELHGGLIHAINAGRKDYVWPPERPPGTELEFRFRGECNYLKTSWALDEILIATLKVLEIQPARWAEDYFGRALRTLDEKFSRRAQGQPTYMLFAGREMTAQPRSSRQDNYHRPRALMTCLLALAPRKPPAADLFATKPPAVE